MLLSTAYLILRPFFRPKSNLRDMEGYLAPDNWVVDLDSTDFPGSQPGKGQELNEKTHPHLRLESTMTSVPKIKPGDQVSSVFLSIQCFIRTNRVMASMCHPGVLALRCNPCSGECAQGSRSMDALLVFPLLARRGYIAHGEYLQQATPV